MQALRARSDPGRMGTSSCSGRDASDGLADDGNQVRLMRADQVGHRFHRTPRFERRVRARLGLLCSSRLIVRSSGERSIGAAKMSPPPTTSPISTIRDSAASRRLSSNHSGSLLDLQFESERNTIAPIPIRATLRRESHGSRDEPNALKSAIMRCEERARSSIIRTLAEGA